MESLIVIQSLPDLETKDSGEQEIDNIQEDA